MQRSPFLTPPDGWVGDLIPWQEDGVFWLYYLHDVRTTPKPGTGWNLLRTTDLVSFEQVGPSLAAGSADDADFNAYTGSIVVADGTHHLYYTGQNPRRLGDDGRALQLVMHATSVDGMRTWQRHPEHTFGAPEGLESGDWRDPFVFRDEEAGIWRMLVAARHDSGPERRRGTIAQCVSTDLENWVAVEPFWDPRRYIAHECPEVFEWNGWWYLVFSEFSDAFTTRYRMSRSLHGPWVVPSHDSIDGRAFYAAKTAEREGRRFFFGWIATREDERDSGAWQWAGTLSTLEARQEADGTLAFGFADETLDLFDHELPMALTSLTGGAELPGTLTAAGKHVVALSDVEAPASFHAQFRLQTLDEITECGVILCANEDADRGYVVRLEPARGRMVFDRWPRQVTGGEQWQISGDVPFEVELERPCELKMGSHVIDVVVEGDICVVNLDRSVSLSTRIYDFGRGRIGFFATEGDVVVESFRLAAPAAHSPIEPEHLVLTTVDS